MKSRFMRKFREKAVSLRLINRLLNRGKNHYDLNSLSMILLNSCNLYKRSDGKKIAQLAEPQPRHHLAQSFTIRSKQVPFLIKTSQTENSFFKTSKDVHCIPTLSHSVPKCNIVAEKCHGSEDRSSFDCGLLCVEGLILVAQ